MSEFDKEQNPFESGNGWNGERRPEENATVTNDSPFVDYSGNTAPVQNNYGGGAPMGEPQAPKKNGLAIAAMVLGIVGVSLQVVCCCCSYLTSIACVIISGVAFGLGLASYLKTKSKMALAGLILGVIGFVLGVILTIVWLANAAEFLEQWEEFMKEYPDLFDDSDSYSGRGEMIARLFAVVKGLFRR